MFFKPFCLCDVASLSPVDTENRWSVVLLQLSDQCSPELIVCNDYQLVSCIVLFASNQCLRHDVCTGEEASNVWWDDIGVIELKVFQVILGEYVPSHSKADAEPDKLKHGVAFSEKGKVLAPHNVM